MGIVSGLRKMALAAVEKNPQKAMRVAQNLTKKPYCTILERKNPEYFEKLVQSSFEPVAASELKSVKELKKFNKTVFGVKNFEIQDENFGQFLTEGFTQIYNKTGGKVKFPKNIKVGEIEDKSFVKYIEDSDTLVLNKEHYEGLVKEMKEHPESNFSEVLKDVFLNQERGKVINYGNVTYNNISLVDGEPGIYHELYTELGRKAYSDLARQNPTALIQFDKNEFNQIAQKVSIKAQESPQNFVAEVYSLLNQGKNVPDDIKNLYSKLGGPAVKEFTYNPDKNILADLEIVRRLGLGVTYSTAGAAATAGIYSISKD